MLQLDSRQNRFRYVYILFVILGSGSNGNSVYLETENCRLLIDAGLSSLQIQKRLNQIGRTPEKLNGILLTHEHTDHTAGAILLAQKHNIPVFCNKLTSESLIERARKPISTKIFQTGTAFEIGDLLVENFSIPHDGMDPVGFLIKSELANVGICTDLGHVTNLVLERIKSANILLLEANHDVKMLQQDTHRPWHIKQRILSKHGHLSNETAAQALEKIVSPELKYVFLGHLSKDCNRPDLAYEIVAERCYKLGANHIRLEVARQEHIASPVFLHK